MTLTLDTRFEPAHGRPVTVRPGIVRVTAGNAGPFTFHGTNSYLVGTTTLAVIDPGPDDDAHLAALVSAIGGRPVSHVLVTHTHRDHSPLAARLQAATGAATVAEGPHRPARPTRGGGTLALDAGSDAAFVPDVRIGDGGSVAGDGWRLSAVATPGHCANHMAFALEGTGVLFCGDHVMGWSTTVVAPPDGSMADYMASLDKLISRDDRLLLPGHGGPVTAPKRFMRGLRSHRRMRERAIVQRLKAGDRHVAEVVRAIYRDIDPRLERAAGLSVLAHLQDLVDRGAVEADGEPTVDAAFRAGR